MIAAATVFAGALGAVLRFVVDGAIKRRWSSMPWATLLINVSGSLVIGLVAGAVIFGGVDGQFQTVIGTGFCGGYTTFSTAAFETVRLGQERRTFAAFGYALGSVVAAVVGCSAGLILASAVLG